MGRPESDRNAGSRRTDRDAQRTARPDDARGVRGAFDRDARGAGDPDLSKLSFEDRMAYYKTKYSAGEAAERAAADGTRGGSGEGRGRNAGAGKPRRDQQGGARNRNDAQDRKQSPKPPKMQGKAEDAGSGKRDGSAQNRGQQNRSAGAQNRGRQQNPAAAQGRSANVRTPAKPDIARENPAAAASAQKTGGFVGLIKKLFGKK